MDFQKYNIKEKTKKKKEEKSKSQELFLNNNHKYIYIYGICCKNLKIVKIRKRRKRKEEKNKTKKKNDCKNSKGISGTFSGVVVGSVGSFHFQIVPWSGLYFLRSLLPRWFPLF